MRFEYLVVPVKVARIGLFDDSKKQTKQLNQYGAVGWKLVTVSVGKKYVKYVFIREIK